MSIKLRFSQAIRGKVTQFLLKYYREATMPFDWSERISNINKMISETENVMELKISIEHYVGRLSKSLWMIIPGSALRFYCKSLESVLNEEEFSDRNLLSAMALEEKKALGAKVLKLRDDFKTTVRKIKKESKTLKKNVSEQQDEIKRLTIENQLLLAALVKMNQEHLAAKVTNNVDNNDSLSDEVAELKAQNKVLIEQNQRLLKTISALIKRPIEEVETILKSVEGDAVDGIVKKLQSMSAKNTYPQSRAFFKPSHELAVLSCSM